jgi:hypothetical protein
MICGDQLVTHLVEDLEVAPHVVEAPMNHLGGHKGGVAGVYTARSTPRRRRW